MEYMISLLEGMITFVSPCLLPMLPIYISYFAGSGEEGQGGQRKTLTNALGFILGFTLVFTALGAFAGTMGRLLRQYQTAVNIVTGAIVILFGLQFLGVLNFRFLGGSAAGKVSKKNLGFFSSLVFGMAFSISWTPCVGAFLGSALMLASQQGSVMKGLLMLLCYSLGLGIPFLVSALLIDRLKNALNVIKRHYGVITKISGGLLIVVGILMMTGYMGYFLSLLTF